MIKITQVISIFSNFINSSFDYIYIYLFTILGECLTVFLNRLIKDVESKTEVATVYSKTEVALVYSAISTFMEYLTLANSSGPENYIKLEHDEVKVEPSEKGEEPTGEAMENGGTEVEKKPRGNVPLQRTIFIHGSMLKSIFKLDDKNTKDHALTKLEKIIEVCILMYLTSFLVASLLNSMK